MRLTFRLKSVVLTDNWNQWPTHLVNVCWSYSICYKKKAILEKKLFHDLFCFNPIFLYKAQMYNKKQHKLHKSLIVYHMDKWYMYHSTKVKQFKHIILYFQFFDCYYVFPLCVCIVKPYNCCLLPCQRKQNTCPCKYNNRVSYSI